MEGNKKEANKKEHCLSASRVFDSAHLSILGVLFLDIVPSFWVDVGGNDPIWNRPKDIIEIIKDYNEKYRLPYIIENDRSLKRRVVVQPEWRDFLMTNYRVIMEWVHDEKIKYLEKRKIEESAS